MALINIAMEHAREKPLLILQLKKTKNVGKLFTFFATVKTTSRASGQLCQAPEAPLLPLNRPNLLQCVL